MSITIVESPSPSSVADMWMSWTTTGFTNNNLLYVGSIYKGGQNVASWLMFEPNIPAGSTLVSVELSLYQNALSGVASLDVRVGWLANDGVWNIQDPSSTAWAEYGPAYDFSSTTAPGAFPDRTGTSDAKWINNFPAFNPLSSVVASNTPASGTAFSFGGGTGISPTFSASDFLTDAQDSFDSNVANRNSRGVPIAVLLVPETSALQLWNMPSNEHTSTALRPTLTIVYDPPAIASEITSTATVAADLYAIYGADAEISASAAVAAALSVVFNNVGAEINASTVVDANLRHLINLDLEITSSATVVAAAAFKSSQASEITSTATVVAAAAVKRSQASEITSSATLEAGLSADFVIFSEMLGYSNVIATVGINTRASAELTSSAAVSATMSRVVRTASEINSTTAVVAGLIFNDPVASEIASSAAVSADLTAIISPLWPIYAKVLNGPAITSAVSVESTVSGAVTVRDAVTSRVFVRGRFHPVDCLSPEERGVRVDCTIRTSLVASEISSSAMVAADLDRTDGNADSWLDVFTFHTDDVNIANDSIDKVGNGFSRPGEFGPIFIAPENHIPGSPDDLLEEFTQYWINIINENSFQFLDGQGGPVIDILNLGYGGPGEVQLYTKAPQANVEGTPEMQGAYTTIPEP